MTTNYLTAICGYCHKHPARPSSDKPICGECFMDAVKRGDPKLHDRIATVIPGYEHRKPKATEETDT